MASRMLADVPKIGLLCGFMRLSIASPSLFAAFGMGRMSALTNAHWN